MTAQKHTRKNGRPASKRENKNGSAEHLKFLLLRPYDGVGKQKNRVSTPDVYVHTYRQECLT